MQKQKRRVKSVFIEFIQGYYFIYDSSDFTSYGCIEKQEVEKLLENGYSWSSILQLYTGLKGVEIREIKI